MNDNDYFLRFHEMMSVLKVVKTMMMREEKEAVLWYHGCRDLSHNALKIQKIFTQDI